MALKMGGSKSAGSPTRPMDGEGGVEGGKWVPAARAGV